MEELKKSYLLTLENDVVISIEIILRSFGKKYRLMIVNNQTDEILFSKIYDNRDDALLDFQKLRKPLEEIAKLIENQHLDAAKKFSNFFLRFLPSFGEGIQSFDFLKDLVQSEIEDSLQVSESIFLDLYKKGNQIIGISSNIKTGKVKKILYFNDMEELMRFFSTDA